MAKAEERGRARGRRAGADGGLAVAGHVFVLFGFAVAQPLFDLVGRNAEFLVAHGARARDVVALTAVLSLLAPALLVAMIGLAWLLWRPLGRLLWWSVVGSLVAAFADLLLQRTPLPGVLVIALATVTGGAAAIVYARSPAVRGYMTLLAPFGLLFPVLFLFFSPVHQLLAADVEPRHYPSVESDVPVVFIVLDEFPLVSLLDGSSRVDPVRYPAFAELAGESYWFRNGTTVAQSTTYAVPAMLTGRFPEAERLPTAAACPDNLFTLLGGGGYRLDVRESQTQLCPPELSADRTDLEQRLHAQLSDLAIVYLHLILPPDLASGLPTISGTWRDFGRAGQPDDAELRSRREEVRDPRRMAADFVDSLEPSSQPTLYFVHLLLPHVPWRFLPSGKEYGPVDVLPYGIVKRHLWVNDDWLVTQAWQRHLLQVEFTDRVLGEILARLKASGLYDRALLVLTADHGSSFRPGDKRRLLTPTNVSDILNVPLFVKLPGQHEGVISDRNVEVVDLLPTIAAVLGVEVPWPVDGQSAIDSGLPERSRKIVYRAELGERAEFEPDMRAGRERTLARQIRLFGERSTPDRLFRIGGHPELLGRRLGELGRPDRPTSTPVFASLEHPSLYDDVDPSGPFIPVYVEGTVRTSEPRTGPLQLAVAVNGRIAAVTRTFDDAAHASRFTAMVPETALRRGHDRVEIAVIRTDGGRTWLEPATGTLPEEGAELAPGDAPPLSEDGFEAGDTAGWASTTP